MKQAFFLLFFISLVINVDAQNVGINTPSPTSAIDINGGLRLRQENTAVSGNSVMLTSNRAHHVLTGSPTGDFTIAFIGATEEGQYLILTNNTLFKGLLVPVSIPANTTVELIYSNAAWKQIGSNESIAATVWTRTGNGGTIDGVNNFFGTADAKPIRFIENNQNSGLFDATKSNYLIGNSAGNNLVPAAIANSSLGYRTLANNKAGSLNTAIGYQVLSNNKNSSYATAVGSWALFTDTAAEQTVAIGAQALYYNQARFGNTAVGTNALYWNTFTNSTPISATQGLHNTALGHSALFNNRRGSGGVAIGYQAAFSDTAAEGIVAIGRAALFNNNGRPGNLAIGDSTLFNNGVGANLLDHSKNNIAIGSKALYRNTRGFSNVALGVNALNQSIVGSQNIAIGNGALQYNLQNGNTAIGISAYASGSGLNNIAIGKNAGFLVNAGDNNTIIGSDGRSAGSPRNISGSIFVGFEAGAIETSNNKLYIENSNADQNNALIYGDFEADILLLNANTINKFSLNVRGSNALEMGYGVAGKQTDAGKICYGCFGDPANWLGIVGGGTQANAGEDRVIKLWSEGGLRIKGNALPDLDDSYSLGNSSNRWNQVWAISGMVNSSDARLKTNIQPSAYGLDEVMLMNPVQYNWKANPTEDLQIGFLAQDIQKIIPEAVVVPANGDPLGMKYTELIPVLVKGMQEQQKIIEKQQKQIATLFKLLEAKQ